MKNTLLILKITLFQLLLFCSFSAFSQCNIDFLFVEITACEGDLFDVSIDFEHENTSNQFTVSGNGTNYGTFDYNDLPITLTSLESDCVTEYEFVVTDVNDNDCSDFFEWGIVCCDEQCALWDLELTPSECDGDDFQVTIDFNYQGNTSPTFDWEIVGAASGYGFFTDLPLTVFAYDVANDDILGFVVSESGNPDCFIETSFENPCFDPNQCLIGALNISASECENNEYYIEINFEYENTSDDFFVHIDGVNYGTYNYSELPIIIEGLESDCGGFLSVEVFDSEFNGTCYSGLDFETVCCEECNITSIDFGDNPTCEDGFILTDWYIFAENTSEVGYDIYVNGVFNTFVDYNGDGPYNFDIEAPATDYFAVQACDNDNPDCCFIWEGINPCFEEQCFIGDLNVEVSECDGNLFFVVIDFEYDNTSDQFIVNGNGTNYGTFLYADLPITIDGIESDCDIQYSFLVYDVNNNNCDSDVVIGAVCCDGDCQMTTLDFGANPACEDGLIVTEWLIDGENISEVGFDIYINNVFEVFVEYNDTDWYDFDIEDPGTENFTIKVCDNDNADCCIDWELMNPCFDEEECELLDLIIETSECDGGEFSMTFDFDYTGNSSDLFDWEILGYSSGVAEYGDLPLTIGIENTNMNEFDLYINDNENSSCAIEGLFENPCFSGNDCFIGDLNVEVSECDGNFFFVVIDFEYDNTSDEFTVNGNGNSYGTFSYADLPITIDGIESDCDIQYSFLVIDVNNNDCASDVGIGAVCCDGDCQMTTLDFGANPACEDGLIVTEWLIDGENISEVGFDIYINNVFEVFVEYNATDWYDFDIEDPGTENFTIKVCDNDNADCCIDWELMNPCFEEEECNLFDLVIETLECDEGGFGIIVDFEYTGTTNEFFDWEIAGYTSGTSAFANLPLSIGIGTDNPGNSSFSILINENDNPDCAVDGTFENPCFDEDCELLDLIIETSECDGGEFSVTFDFDYTGNSSDQFNWEIPGYSSGVAEYGDLPLSIGIDNTNMNGFDLFIYDSENPNCIIEGSFENPCFDGNDCFIGELNVDVSECDGNLFFVVIDFEYDNTSDQFTVNGNGTSYGTFLYADLPITIDGIESDCDLQYEFVVHDVNNNDCASDIGIGAVCCDSDCQMTTLDFGANPACEDGLIVTEWLIDGENISEVGFDIYINNVFEVFVEYNATDWYDFDIEDPGTENFTIKVCDNDNADCCIDWELTNPCFDGEEDCFIGDLDVDVSECDGNLFFVVIDFDYENTSDQFFVNTSGENYGPFSYTDLPITIEELESNCNESYEIQVYDSEQNGTCTSETNIGIICCDDEECDFFDLVIETTECENGYFEVTFDFEYTGTTNDFLIWEIPVIGSGNAMFSELPVTLGLEITDIDGFDLIITEDGNPDCSIDGSFENPCYIGDDCFIGELNVDVSECDGNLFFVVIDFEYDNTSDQFTVNGNGTSYGTFLYADLPITIDGIESDCDLQYEFVVHDVNNNDCASDIGIGAVCCDGDDCIIGELDVEVSECDGNFFFVVINFEYANTSDQFTVNGNGNSYGTFSYSDLPITIDGLESNCDLEFEFVVHDAEFNDCASDISIGEVCCDETECEIVSIDFGDNPICVEGFIVTEWLILGENTSEVGYDIYINNDFYIFVEYNDTDWYDFDIEDPGTEYFTIKACDNDNADCCYTWEVMNPCFEGEACDLFDLNFDVSECDGNVFLLEVDFEYTGTTNEFFEWEIPGVGSGFEMFVNLPITIEIENTTDAQFTFFANENDNPDCDIVGSFGNPCYNSEECWIDDVVGEMVLCEDDLFDVEIDFDYGNVGSTFSIVGNGVEYGTFEYDDLPVTLTGLSADCQLEYEFVIIDADNNDCSSFVELGTICCGDFNQINDIETETIINGDFFNITFKVGNTTLKGCNIEIYVDGELFTTLENDESTFMIGPFDCGQEGIVEIKIINTCSEDEETYMVDLSEIECITNVVETLEDIDLKWNMAQKSLSLEGENPVSVNLQMLNAQGALIFTENSINIGWNRPLDNFPSGLYFVRIVENNANTHRGLIRKIMIY